MTRPVLLTRPEPELGRSAARLRAAGLPVIPLPLLRIEAAGPAAPAILRRAVAAQWLIFTSRNAVRHAPDWNPPPGRCAAIGGGTAEALRERGWPVALLPEDFRSESLLAMPPLQEVAGREIVLVGGSGGRRTLARELRARGARVSKLITYRRRPLHWPAATLREAIAGQPIGVFTSGAALRQWAALASAAELPAALNLDLLVGSQRLCKLARGLGFRQRIDRLARMSDEALARTLQSWQAND